MRYTKISSRVSRAPLFSLALLIIALAMLAGSTAGEEFYAGRPWVEMIDIDGPINPATAHFVRDALASAKSAGARAVLIELDTPGGLMTSAERIVKDLLGSDIPVIVYVAPAGSSAASAGTFITMAANIAAMAPGTTIGAAHPVNETGGDVKGIMGAKVENFAASFARSIARQRGRNEDWAEEAVRHSAVLGEREALEHKVIDIIAVNVRDLLTQASGRVVSVGGHRETLDLEEAVVRRRSMSLGQQVLDTLANPNIAYLLMMAGLIGLYFEFAHPGVFFPGVAGSICLLLALASFQVLPVTISGLLLIFLGIGMLITEAFITSYGVMGLGGVVAFVLGSMLLVDTSKTDVDVSRDLIFGAAAGMALVVVGLGLIAARERRRAVQTGREGLIGEIGEVREHIMPGKAGRLFVHGELWRASASEELEPGAKARVTAVSGLEVKVRKAG